MDPPLPAPDGPDRRVATPAGTGRGWYRGPAAVLLLGLALTGAATQATRLDLAEVHGLELEALARDARTAIERRIATNAEVLYGLRGLHAAEAPLGRADFHDFLSSGGTLERYPGLQAVSFNRLIRPVDVAAFEARVRADRSVDDPGYPGFRVHPRGEASDLFVVDFLEPMAGNEAAFGFDIGSDPIRRAAVEEARDSGDLIATAPLRLVQESGEQRGFLLLLPVYEGEGDPTTTPARRRRFVGVMAVVYGVEDLLAGALGPVPRVRIEEIYDVGRTVESEISPLEEEALLTDRASSISARDPASLPSLHRFLDLNVGSRRWRMLVLPGAVFTPAAQDLLPWGVGAAGALLSVLLAGTLASFARSRMRALALAAQMTAGLREREQDLARTNRELAGANLRLEASARAMREFVAIASHDLRSPLAVVLGFTRNLTQHWKDISQEERRTGLEIIGRRAEQLARLVDDLLTTSEIDAGAISARREVLPLAEVIGQCLDELGDRAAGVEPRTADGISVLADRSHLVRMITNLVENAVKYGAPPIAIEAREEGGWVEVRVRDHGSGVPEAFVPRLFGKFARAETAPGRPATTGTGLGLSIVRGLAEAAEGEAWYEPNLAGGACFGIRLRRA